jgi:hypothetical protein
VWFVRVPCDSCMLLVLKCLEEEVKWKESGMGKGVVCKGIMTVDGDSF